MSKIEEYISGLDVVCIVDKIPYTLNRSNKNDRKKLCGIIQILDELCSVNYIGFNNRDVGSDCFIINIRPEYNLILKNKIDEFHALGFIFGSMTEVLNPIDKDKLSAEYPRMIAGSSRDVDLKRFFTIIK